MILFPPAVERWLERLAQLCGAETAERWAERNAWRFDVPEPAAAQVFPGPKDRGGGRGTPRIPLAQANSPASSRTRRGPKSGRPVEKQTGGDR